MKTVTKETITEYDENGRVTRVTTTETTEETKDSEPVSSVCWYWCQHHNCWQCTCKPSWQIDTTPINTSPSITWTSSNGTNTISGTNVGNDGATATIKF